MARRVGIWAARLALLLALVGFTALTALFGIVTVLELSGSDMGPGDEVAGLPPIFVITAPLTAAFGLLGAGCWVLLVDTFGHDAAPDRRREADPAKTRWRGGLL